MSLCLLRLLQCSVNFPIILTFRDSYFYFKASIVAAELAVSAHVAVGVVVAGGPIPMLR